MSFLSVLCSSLLAALAFAVEPAASFRFHENERFIERPMVRFGPRQALISKTCAADAPHCQAMQALQQAALAAEALNPVAFAGGANPGAVVCVPLGGQLTIGTDARKNEQSFCLFPDETLISTGALAAIARPNLSLISPF